MHVHDTPDIEWAALMTAVLALTRLPFQIISGLGGVSIRVISLPWRWAYDSQPEPSQEFAPSPPPDLAAVGDDVGLVNA